VSGDRSSVLRKRALRRLSHEQYAAYSALYEQVLAEIPGLNRHHARGRAWTRLRYQFPDRYLELFALEQSGAGTEMPPDVRSKSWQRANARLADLRKAAYEPRYAEFRAQGMAASKAYDRAVAVVRDGNENLFARLLAEEYQLWLVASGAAAPAGDRGSADGSERVETTIAAAAAPRSPPGGLLEEIAGEGQRDHSGRLLGDHMVTSCHRSPSRARRDLTEFGRTSKEV
jgi:hypothetical protein